MPSATDLGIESVLDVVENVLGLEGEEHGNEYNLECPDPRHLDSNPSCSVNLETGYWHCFSCGVGGDLLGLAALIFETDREEAKNRLTPSSPEALLTRVQRRITSLERSAIQRSTRKRILLPGPYLSGPLDELLERGFKERTLKRWGVRYLKEETLQGKKGPFTIKNSIAIPIRDRSGHLLAWCYRKTRESEGWQPKYLYTPEIEIHDLWFGLNKHHSASRIVVVEGALDAMWLDQAGIPALGLLGTEMGRRKILELQRYRSVTLLCDKDEAGARSVRRIGNIIGDRVPLSVAVYPSWMPGSDPQELHPVDLEILLERAIPWTIFVQRMRGAS